MSTPVDAAVRTPFPRAADAALMAEWRWRYRRAEWTRRAGLPGGRVRAVAAAALRPFRVAVAAGRRVRRAEAGVAAREGVPRARQLVQLWWLRTWYGIESAQYYRLRLFEPARWPRARGVVREREFTRAAEVIAASDPARGRQLLEDKERIAAWCAEWGIPTAATIVVVQGGRVVAGSAAELPDADLFSKLGRAYGGKGARRWWRRAAGRWVPSGDPDGRAVDREGVIAAACRQSLEAGQPVLIQRALANHPAVARLTNGSLATLRFVTMRTMDGAVQLVSAVLRMPTGDAVVDAFFHGGLAAPVDLASGRLRRAMTLPMAVRGASADTHPETGVRIEGTPLPDWDAVVALVTRAHRAVPGAVPLVGWDVALTADGPVLVEGNFPPSAGLMQVPFGVPLGETPVVACLLDYLRAARGKPRVAPAVESPGAG